MGDGSASADDSAAESPGGDTTEEGKAGGQRGKGNGGRLPAMPRRTMLAAAGGAAVLAPAGYLAYPRLSGFLASDDWRTFRRDHARTGVVSSSAGPGESLEIAWELEASDLLGTIEDTTIGFDEGDDHYVGHFRTSSPVLVDHLVVSWVVYELHPMDDGEQRRKVGLIALDGEDGSLEWTYLIESPFFHTEPTVLDGDIYVEFPIESESIEEQDQGETGDRDVQHLTIIDPTDGTTEEQFELSKLSVRAPVVDDGIYYGHWDNDAFSIKGTDIDGGRRWLRELPDDVSTGNFWAFGLSVSDGSLFHVTTTTEQAWFVCRATEDGRVNWREPIDLHDPPMGDREAVLPPAIVDGRGYAACRWPGGYLRSFDAETGDQRWAVRPDQNGVGDESDNSNGNETDESVDSPGGLLGFPVVVDGTVCATGMGQPAPGGQSHEDNLYLYGIDDEDGAIEWSVPGGFSFAPVAAGDVVYTHADADEIQAVSIDGQILDSVSLPDIRPDEAHSTAIGHGRLYVTGRSGFAALE